MYDLQPLVEPDPVRVGDGSPLGALGTSASLVVERHRTAMNRAMLSRPMALAFEDGVIGDGCSVLDYGCGRGGDVERLKQLGVRATGWDPSHRPDTPLVAADVVNLGYVINVIEDQAERREALRRAWSLARSVLVVAARHSWEARKVAGRPHGDGLVTAKGTFQKFFEQDELRAYVETTLGRRSVAAAPGVFYVFREEARAQAVLAQRTRRLGGSPARVSELLFEQNREKLTVLQSFVEDKKRLPGTGELPASMEAGLIDRFGSLRAAFLIVRRATGHSRWSEVDLGRPTPSQRRYEQYQPVLRPLISFIEDRGRLPRHEELECAAEVVKSFGSVRAAFSLVRRVTGAERWRLVEDRARQNFLVYLALAAFGGRPRFGELPDDLQYDVHDLFGSYKAAVGEADQLLFGAGSSEAIDRAAQAAPVGKLTPEALYVHVSALPQLAPVLRVYEGCGQALAGTVKEATVVKLHRQKPQVSYLSYPTFDSDPHPALSNVFVARLGMLRLTYRDFRDSENPPILHRKELFVAENYPRRETFRRLSLQEDRYGLLTSSVIGTREGWSQVLARAGLRLRGHRLLRL